MTQTVPVSRNFAPGILSASALMSSGGKNKSPVKAARVVAAVIRPSAASMSPPALAETSAARHLAAWVSRLFGSMGRK